MTDRPAPGTEIRFRWRKWDGSPHWVHECVYLGSDEFGDWVGQHPGQRSTRPGRDFRVEYPNISLLPPDGEWVLTRNAAPARTSVYIDVAWDAGWEDGEPVGIDMDLDVVRRETPEPYRDREGVLRSPGEVYIEDRDEWDEHRVAMGYPAEIVDRLESVAVELRDRVEAREAPFDDATAQRWWDALEGASRRRIDG